MQKADLITRFGPSLHSETRPARPANAASVGVCVCRTLTGGASSRSLGLASWFDTRAVASRGVALAGPVSTRARGGAGGVAQQPAIGSKGARIFIAIVCILALTLLHVDMLLYSRVRARTRRKFGTRFSHSHRSLVLTKRDAELGFMGGDDRGGGGGERRRRRRRVTAATSAGDGGRTGRERRSSVPSVGAAAGRRRWSSGDGGRRRSSSSSATRRAPV